MAKVDLGSSYSNFLKSKEIQRAYNFVVDFHNLNGGIDKFHIPDHEKAPHRIDKHRTLLKSHVKNIVLPQYQFESEGQELGPSVRSFPKFTKKPLDLKIEMVEDDEHTIGYFIQYLQNSIMNEYGVYRPAEFNFSKERLKIVTTIFGMNGDKVAEYSYYNCYLQSVSEATYDYASNDAITHNISFNTDYYSVTYFEKDRELYGDLISDQKIETRRGSRKMKELNEDLLSRLQDDALN